MNEPKMLPPTSFNIGVAEEPDGSKTLILFLQVPLAPEGARELARGLLEMADHASSRLHLPMIVPPPDLNGGNG